MCSIVRGGSDTPWEQHMARNPIDEHLGARIRMRRIMLHLSQRTLAGALGMSLHQVRRYEDGAGRIGASELCAIAQALDVAPEFFFADVPRTRRGAGLKKSPMIDFLDGFPDATDGYTLVRCHLRIKDARMKRRIVALVQAIAGD
jgi:transcriptional regulator with XRE-family HTH domain